MQLKKKLIYSALISAGFLFASILSTITPCRTAPRVPNPLYKWGFCTLNPDQVSSLNSIKEFFGYTSSLTEAYALTLILAFAVSFILLHLIARKKD